MVTTTDPRPQLHRAMNALADACDGAYKRDNVGFNGRDTGFGKSLAAQPWETWSPKQTRVAWTMLALYRRQLGSYGIDYSAIPEPPRPEDVQREREEAQTRAPVAPKRTIVFEDNRFVLRYPYAPEINAALKKACPKARWDGFARVWWTPADGASCRGLLIVAATHDFTISRDAEQRMRDAVALLEQVVEVDRGINPAAPDLTGFGMTLRPSQVAVVKYNLEHKRVFDVMEVGLGKTAVAIATYYAAKVRQPLVAVCQAIKKLDWQREIERCIPGARVLVLEGVKPQDVSGYDAIVVNYDILHAHMDAIIAVDPAFVVIDESQYIKTKGYYQGTKDGKRTLKGTRRTAAVQEITKGREYVLALTGTPILNRPSELAEQLRALDQLKVFGGWYSFATKYCAGFQGRFGFEWGRPSDEQIVALNTKLREHCYIPVWKADVLPELPAVQRSIVMAELSNRAQYDEMEDDFIGYLREQHGDEKALKAARAEQLTSVTALKQCASIGKLRAAQDWITDFLETSNDKLIVFSGVIETQQALAAAFPGCAVIRGQDDAATRQAHMDRFQTDPACRLIICSLKAGGTGITLTAAKSMLFLDFAWTPAEHDQAEGRAYGRVNDPHGLNAYYMTAVDTIDEDIMALLDSKRSLVEAVTTGEIKDEDSSNVLTSLLDALLEKRGARRAA